MADEGSDQTTDEDRSSFSESKMTRRRALSFLAGGALGAAVMFYFGFPNSGVSGDSNGDNSTLTPEPSTTAEGGGTPPPTDQSWTTTTEARGSPMAAKIMGTTTMDTDFL